MYSDVQNRLAELSAFSKKSGLARFKALMNLLLNPHKKLNIIHIAGTNGKGSVCSFVSSVLTECGYKTGLFMSPFVYYFGERISIDKKMIPADTLSHILTEVEIAVKSLEEEYGKFTQFEIITAIAFIYFKKENCDVVVLETGIGGRLDVTNICEKPLVTAITSVSLDHTDMLGEDIKKIAFEKAGIIKRNVPMVLYPTVNAEVLNAIRPMCENLNSPYIVSDYVNVENIKYRCFGTELRIFSNDIFIKLPGPQQIYNIKTAVAILDVLKKKNFNLPCDLIAKGLENTYLPGRLEILQKNPFIIADGAHNEQAAKNLRNYLCEHFGDKKIIAIVGMMKDKNPDVFFDSLKGIVSEIITVTINNSRAFPAEDLAQIAKKYIKNTAAMNLTAAVEYSKNKLSPDDILLICGSFYLLGEAKKTFHK